MSTDDVGLKCTADNVLSSFKKTMMKNKKEKDEWIKIIIIKIHPYFVIFSTIILFNILKPFPPT